MERAAQAATLLMLADRIEQGGHGGRSLLAAAARLVPGDGPEGERAVAAARDVLRPAALRVLAELAAEEAGGPSFRVPLRTVTDRGAPVAGTTVVTLDQRGRVVARSRTDARGRATVELAEPGSYTLAATVDPPLAVRRAVGPDTRDATAEVVFRIPGA